MTALAWHNNPNLKQEVMQRLRDHRAADEIVRGIYQAYAPNSENGYRGCAIGCTLPRQDINSYTDEGDEIESPNAGWHGEVEHLYGIPRPIGRLIDGLFESLPTVNDQHAEFAVAVIDAIPVGADLSLVVARFLLDVLADPDHGVRRHTTQGSKRQAAVDRVIELYRRKLAGEEIDGQEWRSADAYADAAAAYAGDAAAYAGDAAAYAAAYADAYAAARIWQAERLIHHLTTAPIGVPA
jgi:hypothetical protein